MTYVAPLSDLPCYSSGPLYRWEVFFREAHAEVVQ